MTKIEILAAIRAVICVIALPFAIRARYWMLTGGWVAGLVTSTCFAAGVGLTVVGVLSMPLYGLFGIHTLYSTTSRRTHSYSFWRGKRPQ